MTDYLTLCCKLQTTYSGRSSKCPPTRTCTNSVALGAQKGKTGRHFQYSHPVPLLQRAAEKSVYQLLASIGKVLCPGSESLSEDKGEKQVSKPSKTSPHTDINQPQRKVLGQVTYSPVNRNRPQTICCAVECQNAESRNPCPSRVFRLCRVVCVLGTPSTCRGAPVCRVAQGKFPAFWIHTRTCDMDILQRLCNVPCSLIQLSNFKVRTPFSMNLEYNLKCILNTVH